jgi:hypothetical protein
VQVRPGGNFRQPGSRKRGFVQNGMELSEGFQARIDNGKRDITEGRVRT